MLYFVKLGGSLITDKNLAHTARRQTIQRLADEIAAARQARPDLRLVIGHGSGSFGHVAGSKHGTRGGVHTPEQWLGYAEVWQEARALNQILLEALQTVGLPVIAFPPSASVIAQDGMVDEWDLRPMQRCLAAGLIPLINGDVTIDTVRGGTILSTETLFRHLAPHLLPQRILLAGVEAGVWADFPACTHLLPLLTPRSAAQHAGGLGGSAAVDVTGGMAQKVADMFAIQEKVPAVEALIFSGDQPGALHQALLGAAPGTVIRRSETEEDKKP